MITYSMAVEILLVCCPKQNISTNHFAIKNLLY